jgi:multidrug efflux system membrane fusion protein
MRNHQILIVRALSGVLAAALVAGCSEKGATSQATKSAGTKAAVPVVVATAETKDVPVELRNIGNVEAYSTVVIRSQITGQIVKIHFHEGQEVKAGDMLFTVDPRPAQGALKQAQADLKKDEAQMVSARLEFERTKKLLESNIGTKDDYDKAQANFQSLQAMVMSDEASVSRATLNLEFTSIRSPIDGQTGNLQVKEGNIVKAPDDTLVTINQIRPIYVTFSVPEQELPGIRRRMAETKLMVEAQLTGDATDSSHGQLSFIDNAVDTTTGRIKLKGTFPNSDNQLWPGQFVQVGLTLNVIKGATLVPSQAIQGSQSGDFVFVVNSESIVEKRAVATGLSRGGFTVVEKGVKPGETVVIDGQLRLAEGSKVVTQVQTGAESSNKRL